MIDHTAIIGAFRAELDNITGFPPDDRFAAENVDFEAPDIDKQNPANSLWVNEQYLPGQEEWVGNRLIQMNGIMEYSVLVPAGTSTEIADDLSLNMRDTFKISTKLGGILTVVRTNRLNGRKEEAWYRVPVRISFRTTQNI